MGSKKEPSDNRSNEEENSRKSKQAITEEINWLDSADVKRRFHISNSTLWRYRKNHKIPFSIMGNKYLYPESFFTTSLKKKIVNAHLL